MSETDRQALARAKTHLSLLEQDPAHPLDLLLVGTASAPVLILREDQALRSAHSDAMIGHGELRGLVISALKRRIAELEPETAGGTGGHSLDDLQYGDQTEA